MMQSTVQLNYDILLQSARKFHDESDDIAQIHSSTLERVRDLHNEWVGQAADRFFEEMEGELLPALQRLVAALLASQDNLNEIVKTFQEADEETVTYFKKGDLSGSAGAGQGQINGTQPGSPEQGSAGPGSSTGTPPNDTGAGGAGSPNAPLDGSPLQAPSAKDMAPFATPESAPLPEAQPAAPAANAGAGGGGGGGVGGQGLQGDLKNMGLGLAGQPAHSAFVGSSAGGAESLPEHNFGGWGSGAAPAPAQQGSGGAGAPSGGEQAASGGGAAGAGVAGVAAAAAAAAKVIKDNQDNKE